MTAFDVGGGGVLAGTGPELNLRELLGTGWRRATLLSVELELAGDAEVGFSVGCPRRCDLLLDGQRLAHVEKPYAAWLDDTEVTRRVGRGRHRLQLKLTPKDPIGEPVVSLRLFDGRTRGPLVATVRLSSSLSTAELAARRVSVRWSHRITERDVMLTATVTGPASTELAWARAGAPAEPYTAGARLTLPLGAGDRARLELRHAGRTLRVFEHRVGREPTVEAAIRAARHARHRTEARPELLEARDALAYRALRLRRMLARQDDDLAFLRSEAATLARDAAALADGHDPLIAERGAVLRAYRSPLDRRLQPFALYVPPDRLLRGKPPPPLMVVLHPSGWTPLSVLRSALGRAPRRGHTRRSEERHGPPIRDQAIVAVAPWGYDGTGSRYFGKRDVLEVLDRVERRHGTDPHRVLLTGGSLGGLGTWQVGLRVPHRFSVLAPMAGYGSVRLYKDIREAIHGGRLLPFEAFLVARRDNATLAANARGLTTWCVHGERDAPRRSEVVVERYRALGLPVDYELLPGRGHNVWDEAWATRKHVTLARSVRRSSRPAHVHLVMGSYQHREAHWVRVERVLRHDALAELDARDSKGRVTLATQNVRALTVDLADGRSLVIDRQELGHGAGPTGVALDPAGRWRRAGLDAEALPFPGEKAPGRSGPIDELRYEPHVFVYGTADPVQTATNRRLAERLARYGWMDADVRFPVRADSELTASELASRHLVLIGGPSSNRVLASIAPALPIQFEANAVVVGGRRHEGASVGSAFIYPNPRAPDRLVLVLAGVTSRGTWLASWLPRWLPDWVVYDEGIAVQRGGYVFDRRRPRDAGNFDARWRLPARDTGP